MQKVSLKRPDELTLRDLFDDSGEFKEEFKNKRIFFVRPGAVFALLYCASSARWITPAVYYDTQNVGFRYNFPQLSPFLALKQLELSGGRYELFICESKSDIVNVFSKA